MTDKPKKKLQDDHFYSFRSYLCSNSANQSPTNPLSSLHLEDYNVLDCEPLHALKGHFANLFAELPYILEGKSCGDSESYQG